MIKKISLENWKSHKNTELEFEEGTNVIIGTMGAGKSSIMDAISFALYGTFPNLIARKVSLEETIMAKPMKQEQAKISMEFFYNEKNYLVERTIRKKGINEATLKEDGKTISGPKTTEVTKKIEEILEVNYDLFSRAIYSEQNQIDFFIKLTPSQRKEKFDELLGLNKYETVRTNSVSVANRIKKINEDRKKFLDEQNKEEKEKELREQKEKQKQKSEILKEKKEQIEKQKKELEEKEKELKELEEKEAEYKFLKELTLKLKAKTDYLEEQIKKAKEKSETKLEEGLEKEKENTEKEIKEQKEKEKEISEKLSVLREKLAVQKSLLESNKKTSEETSKIGSYCPTCKKEMTGEDRETLEKQLREEKQKIEAELNRLEKAINESNKTKEEAGKRLKELEEKDKKLREKIHEQEKLKQLLKEMEENEKEKKELEEEKEKTEKMIEKIDFKDEKIKQTREKFSEIKQEYVKTESEIKHGEELIKEIKTGIEKAEKTIEQINRIEKEVKENEVIGEKISIFNSALLSTQSELRNVMIETINQAMEELWPQIYPYGDIKKIQLKVNKGSYEIMVQQRNDEWVRVEGILSGGERSTAALTIRIAVSLVLTQNLGWIILDEPTHNLDSNAVNELSEMMRSRLPEFINQIFIITHDKQMENAASGKLYQFERKKEQDEPTKALSF